MNKNQKIFNKLEEYFKITDVRYGYITLKKTDLIIPFDKFYFKDKHIPSLFLDDLIDSVENFIKPYKLDLERIIDVYMNTVNYFMDNYKINIVHNLIDTFYYVMNNVLPRVTEEDFYHFKELAELMFIERYKYHNFENEQDEKYFITFGETFFYIVFDAPVMSEDEYKNWGIEKTKEVINYYSKMGDTYTQFLKILYHYILTYPSKQISLKQLYSLLLYHSYNKDNVKAIEKCLIYLAKNNIGNERGLVFLKGINSSYIDEYASLVLMNELCE